jgi:hypothetical protein
MQISRLRALSRFSIGAVLLTDPVLTIVKRELKRISPDVKIDTDQIRFVLEQEVLKREVVECEKADEARKRIARAANKAMRSKTEKSSADENISVPKPESEVCPPSAVPISISPPN